MTAPRPLPRTDYPSDRAALATGYRHLADLIESGQAPIPVNPSVSLFLSHGYVQVDEQPTASRDLMRALGGGLYAKDPSGGNLILRGMCGGLPVDIWLTRDAVCERVVVGTETVELPAEPAREAVPVRIEEREVIEWRCAPLLGAATETADAVEVTA